jgi:hypothetical protein
MIGMDGYRTCVCVYMAWFSKVGTRIHTLYARCGDVGEREKGKEREGKKKLQG